LNAEDIIYLLGIFAIIMIAYGSSIASIDVQTNMNIIFGSFPTFQQTVNSLGNSSPKCAPWDAFCQAGQGVAQATAYIGAAIAYPSILGFNLLGRVVAFGSLMQQITFGQGTGSLSTIPFGNLFLVAILIPIVLYAVKIARGVAQGL
jgi:hypothetical protein